jgi:hypothetical protein
MNQTWQQEAARFGGPALVHMLSELRDGQLDVVASMEALNAKVSQHDRATVHLMTAFPASDVDGHRRYHESVIEWRELRNKVVRECLVKAAQATTLGALGWVALAIWKSFLITVQR